MQPTPATLINSPYDTYFDDIIEGVITDNGSTVEHVSDDISEPEPSTSKLVQNPISIAPSTSSCIRKQHAWLVLCDKHFTYSNC